MKIAHQVQYVRNCFWWKKKCINLFVYQLQNALFVIDTF